MARTAVLGRLTWLVAEVVSVSAETPTARSILLDVPDWPGHLAGQHVDVRLTAPDGYSAHRSYSVATAPDGNRVGLTVQLLPDGEVSSYLVHELRSGDRLELRGPVGGWFVWTPAQPEPVLLVAGGAGVVPMMAMARVHGCVGPAAAPMRLVHSVRDPDSALFGPGLAALASRGRGFEVTTVWTRRAPEPHRPRRVDAHLVEQTAWPVRMGPSCYVCGPTGFVEAVADLLLTAGHPADRIRTERFGATGGRP